MRYFQRSSLGGALCAALSAAALAVPAGDAKADETIDGGAVETVKEDGSGTQASPWHIPDTLYVGVAGEGGLDISESGVVFTDDIRVGEHATARGAITVSGSGSSLLVADTVYVGLGGEGRLSVLDGAAALVGGSVRSLGPKGEILVSGAGSRLDVCCEVNMSGSGGAPAALTVADGAVVSTEYARMGWAGGESGLMRVSGTAAGRGVLETKQLAIGGGSGVLEMDGGVLRATAHEHDFTGNFGAGGFVINSGGAYIDTQAFNIGISAPMQGTGALVKQGTGMLTLSGASTYSGGTQVLGGVVSVASDASLGDPDGALELNGTTLRISDSAFSQSRRNVILGAAGGKIDAAFNSGNGESVTLLGTVSGGDLHKLGRGDLRLEGSNTYRDTYVEEGELIGNARSIRGDVYLAEDGSITFDEKGDAVFAGAVRGAPSGLVSAFKDGAGRLTLAGPSYVNWAVGQGELRTSASRLHGYVVTAPAGTIGFHETGDATLLASITGVGTLSKTGGGILRMPGDNAAFAGRTRVAEGELSVTGRLGGTLAVGQGATLSGSGQVGTARIESGGTVSPGNSIGTLTVAGDMVFDPGSRYAVEVDPQGTASDQIVVRGTAVLNGGSVVHLGPDGVYRPNASYRILSAGTGLSGAFGQVSSNLAFLTPSLAYDYQNHTVDLRLQRNGTSFASQAVTDNQRAVAGGLAGLPGDSELYRRVVSLPAGAAPAAFDALSGEMHADALSALQAAGASLRTVPLAYLRRNLSAGKRPGAPLAQTGGAALPAAALPQSNALPLWAQVTGSWQTLDGDGNAGTLRQSSGGVLLGGDQAVGGGWRAGGALGYSDGRMRVDERGSKTDVRSYSAALYGGKSIELDAGRLNVLVGAAYGRHRLHSRRHAQVGNWTDTLKAGYDADTTQVFGELGYALAAGEATVEPFAGLAWSMVRSDGFTESGGAAALSASSERHRATTSTLGLRASTAFALGRTQGRLHGSLAWRHVFGRAAAQRTVAFGAGQPFTVAGAPLARNSALLELAADIALSPNASLGASYGAQLGGGNREHVGRVDVRWAF